MTTDEDLRHLREQYRRALYEELLWENELPHDPGILHAKVKAATEVERVHRALVQAGARPVSTDAIRARYRTVFSQCRYTWSDVSWLDAADRAALIEERAKLEAEELELVLRAPANPDADPGSPGGWLNGNDVHTPSHDPPRVWRTEREARAAGVHDLAWAPMCRIAPQDRWLLLDLVYWSGIGDVLSKPRPIR